jgi:hypothetical protein
LLCTNRQGAKGNILSNHNCEILVPPGTVVFLAHEIDLECSTWGVSLPYEYWKSKSQKNAIETFQKYSLQNHQIPVMEFGGDEKWRMRFSRLPSNVKAMCPLEDFLIPNSSKPVPRTLTACTFRDGSRYYSCLNIALRELATAASMDYSGYNLQQLRDELKLSAGVQDVLPHGRAIYKWKCLNLSR